MSTNLTPGSGDPVTGLRHLRAWQLFQRNELYLVDFAKQSYRNAAKLTLRQGETVSGLVAARIEKHVRKQTSLYLTLKAEWPNFPRSQIIAAQVVAATLVSQLLVGHHYWQILQAP